MAFEVLFMLRALPNSSIIIKVWLSVKTDGCRTEGSMNKKEIHEIKRRFTKRGCTFTRMCGCYVDGEHNKVMTLGETFLNLEEDDFFKYLDIAKKVLSGKPGNQLLELEFPLEEEAVGGKQRFLMGLKESELKNEELLDTFYDLVIEHYAHAGNYLILLFHDVYDVMKRTKDSMDLDESEEVYEYLICAICPVDLTKPGLGYREEENCIRSRVRDWVVGMPDAGFVFPAFTDRSPDIHSILFYNKDAKNPHAELMGDGLGCELRLTAAEKKIAFESIVKDVIGEDDEKSEVLYMGIQGNLNDLIYQKEQLAEDDGESGNAAAPIYLTSGEMSEILLDSGLSAEQASVIGRNFDETFGEDLPEADTLVEPKLVEANERRKDRLELIHQVDNLKQQLEESRQNRGLLEAAVTEEVQDGDTAAENGSENEDETADRQIRLQLSKEKEPEIQTQIIEGRKYLVIPVEEDEIVTVNGKPQEGNDEGKL